MQIDLLQHQHEFLSSKKKYELLSGGIGSGKSYAGSHYVIQKCIQDGKGKGFIGANTYRQLTNSTLACLFRELDAAKIPYEYKENKGHLTIMDTDILCQSLENFDVIRGVELGFFWIDECRDTKEAAFLVLMGRLRDKRTERLEGRLTTSPNGFDWLYDYFKGDKITNDFHMVKAKSSNNPHLPLDYLQTLKDAYDPKLALQELDGEFININQGRIYYAFDRTKHVKELKFNPKLPIHVGIDFNVNPMTAVVCQMEPLDPRLESTINNVKVHIIDEVYIMTSNTKEICAELKKRYPDLLISAYPDATGRAKKTSSDFSDHEILRNEGLKLFTRASNPFVMDRYNTVNAVLSKDKVLISDQCKNLIKDLEQVSYKDGANLVDKTDPKLTHISDALGYFLFWHYGVKKQNISVAYYV